MKLLLYAAIAGFGCWMISELIEMVQGGYSPMVYYLTAGYHVLAGIGIWGLYQRQTPAKNVFNLISTSLASLAYLALALFPLQVMNSGLTTLDFVAANPVYRVIGFVWFVGMVLFSVSVIRSGHFPKWSGVVILLGTVLFTAIPLLGWPVVLVNLSNILFAATVIYLCFRSLE